jgi:hypothetical protein
MNSFGAVNLWWLYFYFGSIIDYDHEQRLSSWVRICPRQGNSTLHIHIFYNLLLALISFIQNVYSQTKKNFDHCIHAHCDRHIPVWAIAQLAQDESPSSGIVAPNSQSPFALVTRPFLSEYG